MESTFSSCFDHLTRALQDLNTLSLVENWQETCVQSSKLVWFNSPCSPARDAYSLDECQDTLEEEDEEEGHEVE